MDIAPEEYGFTLLARADFRCFQVTPNRCNATPEDARWTSIPRLPASLSCLGVSMFPKI
ncbi:hypothetical protein M405DRAFT_867562 [Rhizopogon salebrosus TDB-379]|nr:hypothetical protein M405DRAFT_867562 [Rhizopogon salebrosus TDB-379]